jgi:ProP effector
MRKQELHPYTALINRKQKKASHVARDAALSWLITAFPKAFDTSSRIQPLKKGIMADILERADEASRHGISKSKLREAVVMFTRRLDYLVCLKAQEMRIDLEGNLIAHVTEEEAASAALKMKKRIEKQIFNARQAVVDAPSQEKRAVTLPENGFLSQSVAATPTVAIRSKVKRAYDPELVQRLKEKIGLSSLPQERAE